MARPIKSNTRVYGPAVLDADATGVVNATQINGVPVPSTGSGTSGRVPVTDGVGNAAWGDILGSFGAVLGDGSAQLSTGKRVVFVIPFACVISSWEIVADVSGSCQFDVRKGTYSAYPTLSSIVGSTAPSLSSQQKNQSSTLTGWTTTISAGDIVEIDLSSVSTAIRFLTLTLFTSRR